MMLSTLLAALSLFDSSSLLCKIGSKCGRAKTDGCKTSADCPGSLSCVIESANYSQCVDCTAASFATQCSYMSETFLPKAEAVCGIDRCPGRCPHHNDTECDVGVCVVEADHNWAQCIDCTNATAYQEQCIYWSADIRTAADARCGLNCTTSPPSPSPTPGPPAGRCHNNTECKAPSQCVEQADHNWAQCIDCTNATNYNASCKFWSPDMRVAAAATCGMTCMASSGGECHAHDLLCPTPQTCVTEADTYYSQCIDCTNQTWFNANCQFWSDKIRSAAEAQCGFTCP